MSEHCRPSRSSFAGGEVDFEGAASGRLNTSSGIQRVRSTAAIEHSLIQSRRPQVRYRLLRQQRVALGYPWTALQIDNSELQPVEGARVPAGTVSRVEPYTSLNS
jgi:hypothetical protein